MNWDKGVFRVGCFLAVLLNLILLKWWVVDDGFVRTHKDAVMFIQISVSGSLTLLGLGYGVGWVIRGFRS